jgi:hypothetical protein
MASGWASALKVWLAVLDRAGGRRRQRLCVGSTTAADVLDCSGVLFTSGETRIVLDRPAMHSPSWRADPTEPGERIQLRWDSALRPFDVGQTNIPSETTPAVLGCVLGTPWTDCPLAAHVLNTGLPCRWPRADAPCAVLTEYMGFCSHQKTSLEVRAVSVPVVTSRRARSPDSCVTTKCVLSAKATPVPRERA